MLGKVGIISVLVIALAYYFRSGSKADIRDGKVIKTKSGEVRGSILSSRDGRDYYAWHKIPYAKPPVGDLRFADPLPLDNWSEVIDGREMGPECTQVNIIPFDSRDLLGSEDCLHLNVFAPKQLHDGVVEGKRPKHPVIVYIHGGAYIGGSSSMGGPQYFMDEDVVYVNLNYRLDILGFLTTGDRIARGNQGLKDQTMALKWVKNNIERFGGDPNKITIIGTSAGGASVHQQTLSPLSKGLFQRAFSQSGAASNTWGFITLERSLEKTTEIAQTFNCPTKDNQGLIDCLRKLDVETLLSPRVFPLQEEYGLFKPHVYGEGFEPIIEAVKDNHAFITEHPLKIVLEGKAHGVPHLMGHATHEGLFSSVAFNQDSKNLAKFEAELVPALRTIFAINNPNAEEISKKIYNFYFPEGENLSLDEKIRRYVDLFGDAFFNFDIRETVRLQRKFSPVYFYLQNNTNIPDMHGLMVAVTWKWPYFFAQVGWHLLKEYAKEKLFGIVEPHHGVGHAADGIFYFPMELFGTSIGKDDKLYQTSKDLVHMVVQFAIDDTKMEFRGVKIPPTPSEGPLKVAEFRNEDVVISPEPFTERMEFLRSLKIR